MKVLVDFAHNPHGITAIAGLVANIPAKRRLVLLGQAGDRTDAEIQALAAAVRAILPDRVVIKEMESYLRGPGPSARSRPCSARNSPAMARPRSVTVEDSETAAVRAAFAWAEAGDLLVLLSHAARARTMAFLDRLQEVGWRPGEPLPHS